MTGVAKGRHIRRIVLCILVYLAGMGGYLGYSVLNERRAIFHDLDHRLLLGAAAIKHLLPAEFHDLARDAGSFSHADEVVLRAPLTEFANEAGFKYLYTVIEKEGRFYFGLSSETAEDLERGDYDYFLPYEDMPPPFLEAWREDHPVYENYSDKWGEARSVILPQRSPAGRRYLACADIDASEVRALLREQILFALATSLFFTALTIPFILAYRRFIKSHSLELQSINAELIDFQTHLGDLVAARTHALCEAKDAAEEANRVKSRFLFNISHEIRTPMNGIISYCEAILETGTLAQAQQFAKVVLRESEVLHRMIGDLLDHAKLEEGKMELDPQPLNLAELLENITSAAHMMARAKGLHYECRLEPQAPPCIRADFLRLRQVLLNLVVNAIKFTERGEVLVTVGLSEDLGERARLRFAVRDTGIGIPREKHKAIFESFHQADLSTTRKHGGTGLGTAIAQQLVRLMGGEIQLESEPGEGSTFWFEAEFDKTPHAEPWEIAEEANPPALPQVECLGNLLVAEDYPTNQEIIRMFLEEAGHRVTVVGNGRLALEASRRERYDLILMDIQMPEMDGYEAAHLIRSEGGPNAAIPIVALTASAETQSRLECRHFGMNDVLLKPFRHEMLLETVTRWLKAKPQPGETQPLAAPAPAPAEAAAEEPLRMAVAAEEFGGEDVVLKVADQFMINLAGQLELMSRAIDAGDYEALQREAHALKGGAGTLEATPLAKAVRLFEQAAKEQAPADGLAAAFSGLVAEAARLQVYLEEFRGGGDAAQP